MSKSYITVRRNGKEIPVDRVHPHQRRRAILAATNLMDVDFAQWRAWSATIRDTFPEGHQTHEKSVLLCQTMDAWHNAWLFERRTDSAKNLTLPLEEPIEKLVAELLRLGIAPPAKPKDTNVKKNTGAP